MNTYNDIIRINPEKRFGTSLFYFTKTQFADDVIFES